jgi:hypothetical protein
VIGDASLRSIRKRPQPSGSLRVDVWPRRNFHAASYSFPAMVPVKLLFPCRQASSWPTVNHHRQFRSSDMPIRDDRCKIAAVVLLQPQILEDSPMEDTFNPLPWQSEAIAARSSAVSSSDNISRMTRQWKIPSPTMTMELRMPTMTTELWLQRHGQQCARRVDRPPAVDQSSRIWEWNFFTAERVDCELIRSAICIDRFKDVGQT